MNKFPFLTMLQLHFFPLNRSICAERMIALLSPYVWVEYAEERALTAEQTLRKFLFTFRIYSQTWARRHEYADLHPRLLHGLHNQQKGFSPVTDG